MTDKYRLVIIGAGGHGKVAAECAESMGIFDNIVFLDGVFEQVKQVGPWHIVGQPEAFSSLQNDNTHFFVAIGDNKVRQLWLSRLRDSKASIATLIHASATMSEYSSIGEGGILCAHSVVNPFSCLGLGAILNTGATLDHDCEVADYVHIAPGCNIAGGVKIGDLSFIGIGSSVLQSVNIGKKCVLGAGSVVVSDIKENTLGYGVPAKIIKVLND